METVLEAVVIGRACRNTANIKNRQPIGKMYIKADAELSEFLYGHYQGRAKAIQNSGM